MSKEETASSSQAGSFNQINNYSELTEKFDFSVVSTDQRQNIILYKLLGKENKKELSLIEINGKFTEETCMKLRSFFQDLSKGPRPSLFLKIFKVFLNDTQLKSSPALLLLAEKINEPLNDYLYKSKFGSPISQSSLLLSYLMYLLDIAYLLKSQKSLVDLFMTSLYFFVKECGNKSQRPVKILMLPEDITNLGLSQTKSAGENTSLFSSNLMRQYSTKGVNQIPQTQTEPYTFFSLIEEIHEKVLEQIQDNDDKSFPTEFLTNFSLVEFLKSPQQIKDLIRPFKEAFTGLIFRWEKASFFKSDKDRFYQNVLISEIINKKQWIQLLNGSVNIFVKKITLRDCSVNFFENPEFLLAFKMIKKLKICSGRLKFEKRPQIKVSHLVKILTLAGAKSPNSLRNLTDITISGQALHFPEGLTSSEKGETLELQKKFRVLASLKTLKLKDCDMTSAESSRIFEEPLLNCLQNLDLSRNKIHLPISDEWGCNLTRLTHLNLSENMLKCGGCQRILECDKLPNLYYLNLSDNKIINPLSGNQKFALSSIKTLVLSNNWIESSGSQMLFNCTKLASLEALVLTNNKIEIPLAKDTMLINLLRLDFSRNQISNEGSRLIFGCKNFLRLQQLFLSNNNIDVPFKKFLLKNLEKLDLSHNKINNLGSFSIFSLDIEYLNTLNLSHNMIFSPVDEKFRLKSLKTLDLSSNIIFDDGTRNFFSKLEKLDNLKKVNLSRNKIVNVLLPTCSASNKIEELDLSFNEIDSKGCQNLFSSKCFTKLLVLNLIGNSIVDPGKELNMISLERLLLAGNKLSARGASELFFLQKIQNLKVFDVTGNEFVAFPPDEFFRQHSFKNLSKLLLQKNWLEDSWICHFFSPSSAVLEYLTELDLSKNNLSLSNIQMAAWERFIINLPVLERLDFSSNRINSEGCGMFLRAMCSKYKGLKAITCLNLSNNVIEDPTFDHLRLSELCKEGDLNINLKVLNLGFNALKSEGCQNFLKTTLAKKIEVLVLKNNHIEVPMLEERTAENFLKKLDLSYNKVSSRGCQMIFLSKFFEKLEFLDISSNSVELPIKGDSCILKNLRFLYLDKNNIKCFGSNLIMTSNLKKLEYLGLASNLIINPFIKTTTLTNLEELELSRNKIETSGAQIVMSAEELKRLRMLNLSENGTIELTEKKLPNLTTLYLNYRSNDPFLDELEKEVRSLLMLKKSESPDLIFEAGENLYNQTKSQVMLLKNSSVKLTVTRPRKFISYCHEFCGFTGVSIKTIRFLNLGRDINPDTIVSSSCMVKVDHTSDFNYSVCNPLKTSLQSLLNSGLFADVTIVLNGTVEIPAHKNILSCRSHKFNAMFTSNFLESQTNIVSLQFKKPEIFKLLLLWMYCGEVKFPENIFDVFELLLLADEYGLNDLKEKCEEDMKLKLHEANVLQMLILCETHPIVTEALTEKCKSLFIQEFDQIQKINPNLEKEIIAVPGLMIKLFAHIHSKKNKKRKVTFVIEEHISENE